MLELEPGDGRWERFAAAHGGGPFQHPSWMRLLADLYGFRAFVAAREAGGEMVAAVPFVEVRGRVRRAPRWVSLPFTDHSPVLAGSAAARDGLLAELEATARARGVAEVQVRDDAPLSGGVAEVAVRHVLTLPDDPAVAFAGFHAGHVRRAIRKAEKAGRVRVRPATRRSDLDRVYYGLHSHTRRRQGTPVQPRRLFTLLWDRIHERGLGETLLAEVDGEVVAGAVFLRHNGTLIYKYGASDPGHLRERPNHLIFWDAIQRACARGDRRLDFGRSNHGNQGLRDFKSHWGAQEIPLLYASTRGVHPPGEGLAHRALAGVITRAPVQVAQAVGTALYRSAA